MVFGNIGGSYNFFIFEHTRRWKNVTMRSITSCSRSMRFRIINALKGNKTISFHCSVIFKNDTRQSILSFRRHFIRRILTFQWILLNSHVENQDPSNLIWICSKSSSLQESAIKFWSPMVFDPGRTKVNSPRNCVWAGLWWARLPCFSRKSSLRYDDDNLVKLRDLVKTARVFKFDTLVVMWWWWWVMPIDFSPLLIHIEGSNIAYMLSFTFVCARSVCQLAIGVSAIST